MSSFLYWALNWLICVLDAPATKFFMRLLQLICLQKVVNTVITLS